MQDYRLRTISFHPPAHPRPPFGTPSLSVTPSLILPSSSDLLSMAYTKTATISRFALFLQHHLISHTPPSSPSSSSSLPFSSSLSACTSSSLPHLSLCHSPPPSSPNRFACPLTFSFRDNHWDNDVESVMVLHDDKSATVRETDLSSQESTPPAVTGTCTWVTGTNALNDNQVDRKVDLHTPQLAVKNNNKRRIRNWPLLPLATEVKQRRKKDRKFILSIWGRKGK